jgi:hypothetical protein
MASEQVGKLSDRLSVMPSHRFRSSLPLPLRIDLISSCSRPFQRQRIRLAFARLGAAADPVDRIDHPATALKQVIRQPHHQPVRRGGWRAPAQFDGDVALESRIAIAGNGKGRSTRAADPGPAMDQQRALMQGVAAEIENRLHHVAVRRRQARNRFDDIVKRQPQMPLAGKFAPVDVRIIRRQQRQQVEAVKARRDAIEGTERADVDHEAIAVQCI